MEKLTPEERKQLAQSAARARWDKTDAMIRATHSGTLTIGNVEIPCFVLEDGTRVISGRGMTTAIGMKGRGQGAARIVAHKTIIPFLSEELRVAIETPLKFLGSGSRKSNPAAGYEATVLHGLAEAILTARDAGALKSREEHRYGKACEILVRALAKVGIIALVDEATGYQEVRDRKALQEILDRYIGKELAKWVKTFPEDFYEQIFRLRGWEYQHGSTKRPMLMAKLTADLVYSRLAPGVLEELRRMTPKDDKGRRKAKLFQGLTMDIGHPALKDLIAGLTFLAKTHRESEWGTFYDAVNRAAPQYGKTMMLPFAIEPKEDEVLPA